MRTNSEHALTTLCKHLMVAIDAVSTRCRHFICDVDIDVDIVYVMSTSMPTLYIRCRHQCWHCIYDVDIHVDIVYTMSTSKYLMSTSNDIMYTLYLRCRHWCRHRIYSVSIISFDVDIKYYDVDIVYTMSTLCRHRICDVDIDVDIAKSMST